MPLNEIGELYLFTQSSECEQSARGAWTRTSAAVRLIAIHFLRRCLLLLSCVSLRAHSDYSNSAVRCHSINRFQITNILQTVSSVCLHYC